MITFDQFHKTVKNYVALYPNEVHALKIKFEVLDLGYDAEDLVIMIDNMLMFPDKLSNNAYDAMKADLMELLDD